MGPEKLIYTQVSKIMGEVGAIEKTRRSPQGYSYRGIDDVLYALQPLLTKYGVFFVPTVQRVTREERQTQKGGNLIYTLLEVSFTFYAADGSSITAVTAGEGMDSSDKSSNKAMSAALKYALFQTFCIPTDDPLEDTEAHPHEAIAKKVDAVVSTVKDGPISVKQLGRLRAIAAESGWNEKDLQDLIFERLDIDDLAKIPWTKYDNICTYIGNKKKV